MKYLYTLLFMMVIFPSLAETYYVDLDGSNSNSGTTITSPFQTITYAISKIEVGDSIIIRGGVYTINESIYITNSGSASDTCFLFAYPGERPILDFSGTQSGKRAIILTGSYWYFKGFDIINANDNGLLIYEGAHNLIEFCRFHDNKDTGLQLGGGAHDNTIVNCDSYHNADPEDYGDADGFAPKLDVGTNNKFVGCRAWGNCDDGWDGYMRGATNVTTILENCWTWGNGYLKDGTNPGAQANGNGFKMGGGDNGNAAKLEHHFYLTNCMAFFNKAKGFDQNNNVGTMSMLNCTGFKNAYDYVFYKTLADNESVIIKNSISFEGNNYIASFALEATNSWVMNSPITSLDFESIDTTGISGPRKEDGSLPDVAFMHLNSESTMIDKGTDVGLPFNGTAPDLGAFEYGQITSIEELRKNDVNTYFSGNSLFIKFLQPLTEPMHVSVYNLNGQILFKDKLTNQTTSMNFPFIQNGIYILEMKDMKTKMVKKIIR